MQFARGEYVEIHRPMLLLLEQGSLCLCVESHTPFRLGCLAFFSPTSTSQHLATPCCAVANLPHQEFLILIHIHGFFLFLLQHQVLGLQLSRSWRLDIVAITIRLHSTPLVSSKHI